MMPYGRSVSKGTGMAYFGAAQADSGQLGRLFVSLSSDRLAEGDKARRAYSSLDGRSVG